MIPQKAIALSYLKAVERKNQAFFAAKGVDILSCVKLKGKKLLSVHVVDKSLPEDIKFDIETMFWRN